jgi:ribA/ribD-fused uncharacterized protein
MPSKRKAHPTGRALKPTPESDFNTIYFYMPNAMPYGVFCQWHINTFTIPTSSLHFLTTSAPTPSTASDILNSYDPSIAFTCAEQSYMFCKSLFFSSAPTCTRILATPDPKEQKKLGQQVPNFSEWHWDQVKSRVARVGNWYKFTDSRNGHMRSVLMGTEKGELVEAARRDRVWGIGYNEEEAERYREFWGENLLGRCLVDVRGRIGAVGGKIEEGVIEEWGEWDGEMGDHVAEEEKQ